MTRDATCAMLFRCSRPRANSAHWTSCWTRRSQRAGAHLAGIISPERRLSAADLARYLVGVRHLVVATVTESGEPRCSAVDGLFIHGDSGSRRVASRSRRGTWNVDRRSAPRTSIGDDVGIFVHGEARMVHGGPGEADELRHYWTRRLRGGSPEDWVRSTGGRALRRDRGRVRCTPTPSRVSDSKSCASVRHPRGRRLT